MNELLKHKERKNIQKTEHTHKKSLQLFGILAVGFLSSFFVYPDATRWFALADIAVLGYMGVEELKHRSPKIKNVISKIRGEIES